MRIYMGIVLAALLLAAPFVVGTAQAQASYVIDITTGTPVTSSNFGAVSTTDTFTGATLISGGLDGRIGTTAAGASSSAAINVTYATAAGYLAGGTDTFAAHISKVDAVNGATGTTDGAILTNATFTGTATISGVNTLGNMIGSTAIGATSVSGIIVHVVP